MRGADRQTVAGKVGKSERRCRGSTVSPEDTGCARPGQEVHPRVDVSVPGRLDSPYHTSSAPQSGQDPGGGGNVESLAGAAATAEPGHERRNQVVRPASLLIVEVAEREAFRSEVETVSGEFAYVIPFERELFRI